MFHLIHPALVHFGIAFVVTGALLEAYGLARSSESARRLGAQILALGTLTIILMIASGYLAANTINLPDGAGPPLAKHERSGWILLGWLVLLQFWKAWYGGHLTRPQAMVYAAGLLLAAGWLVYTALLGGTLVYSLGVGVGQGS